jgi:hypothetical protein
VYINELLYAIHIDVFVMKIIKHFSMIDNKFRETFFNVESIILQITTKNHAY